MKLLISTVRNFKSEDREAFIRGLCETNRRMGLLELSRALASLATEREVVLSSRNASDPDEWVETTYEIVEDAN
jgi:hypothetical protein